MSPAQCQNVCKRAIGSFVVPLDPELAQVSNEGVGLCRRDAALALRKRQDVCNFNEPPCRHERGLRCQAFQQTAVFGVASSWNNQAMAMEQSTTNAALIAGPH